MPSPIIYHRPLKYRRVYLLRTVLGGVQVMCGAWESYEVAIKDRDWHSHYGQTAWIESRS